MDYKILDDLMDLSNKRRASVEVEDCLISQIEELNGWKGSSDFIRAFIFKNFIEITKQGNAKAINLLIICRDTPSGKKSEGGLEINNVETTVVTLPQLGYKFPTSDRPKTIDIHPEHEKFIIEKRSLPKKPYDPSVEFDPEKHRWSTMQLAEKLHISNRTIGAYCKEHNI